ncbi:hypothetical protein V8C26DRAFT_416960 [Trichoderma gracile]
MCFSWKLFSIFQLLYFLFIFSYKCYAVGAFGSPNGRKVSLNVNLVCLWHLHSSRVPFQGRSSNGMSCQVTMFKYRNLNELQGWMGPVRCLSRECWHKRIADADGYAASLTAGRA